jgi:hypothetical protein
VRAVDVSILEKVHAGLGIILSYKAKNPGWESYCNCGEGVIYAGDCIGFEMSEADEDKMGELGWFKDDDGIGWHINV